VPAAQITQAKNSDAGKDIMLTLKLPDEES